MSTGAVRLRRHDGAAVREDAALRAQLVAVYADAFAVPPYGGTLARAERWAADGLPRHTGYPGFGLVTAERDGVVLGFGYGLLAAEDQWFTRMLRERLPADLAQAWVGGHGELVELAVLGSAQGSGLGGRLHDAVLDLLVAAGATTALLAVHRGAPAPRALYTARGWRDIAPIGAETTLMGRRLPSARSAGFSEPEAGLVT